MVLGVESPKYTKASSDTGTGNLERSFERATPFRSGHVTASSLLPRLSPEAVEQFIPDQLDRAGLGRNTFIARALPAREPAH